MSSRPADRAEGVSDETISIVGSGAGADAAAAVLEAGVDCVTVPFEPAEFVAPVRAGLREVALRADQTRLQALVANVPGAIYRCSHDADYAPAHPARPARRGAAAAAPTSSCR